MASNKKSKLDPTVLACILLLTDPRVKDWPLISSPLHGSLLILAYLLFVWLGPKWMAHRPAFQLERILLIYNFAMVMFCSFVAYEMMLSYYGTGFTLSCNWTVDYSDSPAVSGWRVPVGIFFIAKFIELLDTAFFILRKKTNQVTFLHVFHHGCLPMFWWWGVKFVPGGFGTFHAFVNLLVHVVMYLYYGIAALGPRFHRYLWWKRYVTILQLSQFFIVTLHNSQYLFYDCAYPWKFVAAIQGFTTIVALLFLNFYVKTYKRGTNTDKQGTNTDKRGVSTNTWEDDTLKRGTNKDKRETDTYKRITSRAEKRRTSS